MPVTHSDKRYRSWEWVFVCAGCDLLASSERSDAIDDLGGLDTAMVNWRENFEQTEPYIGRTITRHQFDEIQAFIGSVAEDDAELFDLRVREGRARDCHGDLRADAVCFE